MPWQSTREHGRENHIETWMLTTVQDGGVLRMDDLHIDQLDDRWRPREYWVQGGIEAFRVALSLRDRHHLPFTVVLGFSLQSGQHSTGVDFENTAQLAEKLNSVPPSLYLFQPGKTPRTDTTNVVIRDLMPGFFGTSTQTSNCYYIEFRPAQSTEYNRSVFVEG
jgi:hypothetical protein